MYTSHACHGNFFIIGLRRTPHFCCTLSKGYIYTYVGHGIISLLGEAQFFTSKSGVFKEIRELLKRGDQNVYVHTYKNMPSGLLAHLFWGIGPVRPVVVGLILVQKPPDEPDLVWVLSAVMEYTIFTTDRRHVCMRSNHRAYEGRSLADSYETDLFEDYYATS